MNHDQFEGRWKELKGKVKEQWGKLTDDDLLEIEGNQDQLIGRVQHRYGVERAEAEAGSRFREPALIWTKRRLLPSVDHDGGPAAAGGPSFSEGFPLSIRQNSSQAAGTTVPPQPRFTVRRINDRRGRSAHATINGAITWTWYGNRRASTRIVNSRTEQRGQSAIAPADSWIACSGNSQRNRCR
jgi:uncharacterized protein YjbJ (UPF0337 family)